MGSVGGLEGIIVCYVYYLWDYRWGIDRRGIDWWGIWGRYDIVVSV